MPLFRTWIRWPIIKIWARYNVLKHCGCVTLHFWFIFFRIKYWLVFFLRSCCFRSILVPYLSHSLYRLSLNLTQNLAFVVFDFDLGRSDQTPQNPQILIIGHLINIYFKYYNTVKVMIMSRYPYRPVTVLGSPLPTVTVFWADVTQRYETWHHLYRSLPNFTVTSVTDPNIGRFEQIFKILFKKINVTLVTQTFGNGQ